MKLRTKEQIERALDKLVKKHGEDAVDEAIGYGGLRDILEYGDAGMFFGIEMSYQIAVGNI
jgi:hypothetical protein